MTQSLPSRPSLEHLKNQAKALLRAARSGDSSAAARLARHNHGSTQSEDTAREKASSSPRPTLAVTQYVIAREYGFANWSELKQQVELAEVVTKSRSELVAVLVASCFQGDVDRAERIVRRCPDLANDSIFVAAALGEAAIVHAMLDRDPSLVNASGGPLDAHPLVYACRSRFASPRNSREPSMRVIVGELLRRGADPNAGWFEQDSNHRPLSALYGACGINGNAELARLLLDAGATPDDNESLYHSVEHEVPDCTALLLSYGATITGTNAVHHSVALGNVAALKLFLQQGGDANERLAPQRSLTLLHWAIDCNQGREVLELLIEHGADLRARSIDGRTPFRHAACSGHGEAVALLTQRGAGEELIAPEAFLAACMTGDEQLAKSLLSTFPNFLRELPAHHRSHLHDAAWRGRLAAVRTLLSIGFHVDWGNQQRATALHAAAWQGHAEIVQLLLAHHARLDIKDDGFHCTPLEWALHGSQNCRPHRASETVDSRSEAYASIVSALLAAGSPTPIDRLVRICAGRVEEVLADAGILAVADE